MKIILIIFTILFAINCKTQTPLISSGQNTASSPSVTTGSTDKEDIVTSNQNNDLIARQGDDTEPQLPENQASTSLPSQELPPEPELPELPVAPAVVPQTVAPQTPSITPPENSVTKGSFTVWTEPKDPKPQQDYSIFIQATYSGNTTNVQRSDLTGCIQGTDNFAHKILANTQINNSSNIFNSFLNALNPKDVTCNTPDSSLSTNYLQYVRDQESFTSSSNKSTLRVEIPGALEFVRDTINVRSSILNESQTITIQF